MSGRTVVLELAGEHKLARDLVAGGVFVPGYDLPMNEDCELLLRGASQQLSVSARVVWNGNGGVGLQLIGCDADLKQKIVDLASAAGQPVPAEALIPKYEFHFDDAETAAADGHADGHGAADGHAANNHADDASAADANGDGESGDRGGDNSGDPDGATDGAEGDDSDPERKKLAANVHERLRGLTLAQQIKLAHHGEVSERVVLERLYGKAVWEALLRNPRLTGPEVARIARMGSLPRTLLEIILNNGGWLQIPEVRRALLSNPRLGTDQVIRILRLLPKHELKMAAVQTAYPMQVRDAAKRILKE